MTGALAMHDQLLRELLHHHCGYEVIPPPCCSLSLLTLAPSAMHAGATSVCGYMHVLH